jgi:hypothetical protein
MGKLDLHKAINNKNFIDRVGYKCPLDILKIPCGKDEHFSHAIGSEWKKSDKSILSDAFSLRILLKKNWLEGNSPQGCMGPAFIPGLLHLECDSSGCITQVQTSLSVGEDKKARGAS